jgi:hypothetical protein
MLTSAQILVSQDVENLKYGGRRWTDIDGSYQGTVGEFREFQLEECGSPRLLLLRSKTMYLTRNPQVSELSCCQLSIWCVISFELPRPVTKNNCREICMSWDCGYQRTHQHPLPNPHSTWCLSSSNLFLARLQ